MRQEAPIYRCPHTGMFFVFDYETIRTIAGNPELFSNKFGKAMRSEGDVDPRLIAEQKKGYPAVDTMLTEDPPVHRRYRGLVNQAFTARRVATLEPDIAKDRERSDRCVHRRRDAANSCLHSAARCR